MHETRFRAQQGSELRKVFLAFCDNTRIDVTLRG